MSLAIPACAGNGAEVHGCNAITREAARYSLTGVTADGETGGVQGNLATADGAIVYSIIVARG
jgi:hypothetical protein